MKILAFGASNSENSINQMFAAYTTKQFANAEVEMLHIDDYEMPLFSMKREEALGNPDLAKQFFAKIGEADLVIISFAEHNGIYTAAYKNLFDWTSRVDSKVFQNKDMILLSTSPGPGGAASVLAAATKSAPYFAGNVKASISLPSFYAGFDSEKNEVTNEEVKQAIQLAVSSLS
ncbi:MAG: NADPH-dependent FMN reductase [Colwellia sp.]